MASPRWEVWRNSARLLSKLERDEKFAILLQYDLQHENIHVSHQRWQAVEGWRRYEVE
ncbi:uncharacterized protein LOC142559463 isoform X2 [Dermacentor variabilis]|uniref:uncharacterized protein LOC142559463 isoform X2 n=1 Tax=Dermacentor variabilis TaxID=34621 RepID=UPI003F5B6DC0